MIHINDFTLLLDPRVERQLVHFWIYASLNERGTERIHNKLTVRLIDKGHRAMMTLGSLVEKIMLSRPTRLQFPAAPLVFDFRAAGSPADWLNALPRGISPQFTPPHLPAPRSKALALSGQHPVRAIVVDESFIPSGALRAYDTCPENPHSAFGVKYNDRSLTKEITGRSHARRRPRASLYDFRLSAFLSVV